MQSSAINKLVPRIAICHQSISLDDIINHDVIGMYKLLTKMGLKVTLVGEFIDERLKNTFNFQNAYDLVKTDFDILIYHHSSYWQLGEKLIKKFRKDLIIKFHHIIQPHFFSPYSLIMKKKCQLAWQMTESFIQKSINALWLTDSFNDKSALKKLGCDDDKIKVVSPFNRLDLKLNRSNQNHDCKKIIFAGNFFPHNGHMHLVNILKEYIKNFSPSLELQMIGSTNEELQIYFYQLLKKIHKDKMEKNVRIFANIPYENLATSFEKADLFICMSEDEGFQIPILEAQARGIPIIAGKSPEISEMIGYGLGNFPEKNDDYLYYAQMLHEALQNQQLRESLIHKGIKNVTQRFLNSTIETQFITSIYPILKKYI